MTSLALIFTLSAIGISETSYLIRKRIAAEKPVCPIGEDCLTVLTSAYSKIFIIPNDVIGLFVYVIISLVSAFLVIGITPMALWSFVLNLLVAVASLVSFLFIYLQKTVIRAWCFWCVMSAFTFWLMGIIIILKILI